MDSVLILFKKLAWRTPGSAGQICNGFCIDFVKKMSLESSRAQTDRFVMDFVLICLRNRAWRALDSIVRFAFDRQIRNRFCIDFIKKMNLESSRL